MSQSVDALLAALVMKELGQPSVPLAPEPAGARPPAAEPPSSETAGVALHHYYQALEALRKGDWQTFGVEMEAVQKTLESAVAATPPS